MKVDKILPCVCCDHEPNAGDSVYYGMPQLKVCGSGGKEWYTAFCPVCGRSSFGIQAKSAYLALIDWNRMQENCRRQQSLFEE